MVGIILAAHGEFGEGVINSAKMLSGDADRVKVLSMAPGMSTDTFMQLAKSSVDEVDDGDGVIALVDVFGGTPCNTFFNIKNKFNKNIKIVTGVNLPMVLTILSETDKESSVDDIADIIVDKATKQIKVL